MSLYENVIDLAKPYLGIVTQKFIDRQCNSHLKVLPMNITREHIPELAKWVGVSAGLLMPQDKAAELKDKILALN